MNKYCNWLNEGPVHIIYLYHPAETLKNSDICDFLKVSDIGKSIVLNGETYILNDTTQFQRRSHGNIYIENFTTIGTSELC